MENYDKEYWQDKKCPPINCKKKTCECGLEKVFLPSALGDDSASSPIAPKNGGYCNAIVVYEANGHIYIYSKEGIPTLITSGGGGDYDEIIKEIQKDLTKTEGDLAQEVLDRAAGDKTLQDEIDDLKNSPDVVDIVDTYADLQAYDTSHLGDKDIIRVLADETHDGVSSYYRWNKQTETWTYIGSIQTAANTIFYADLSETGNTRHIYKNSDMTGTVSVQELLDANEDGQVILRMSSAQTPENFNDAYLQNTYVGVGDYQFLFLDNRNYYEYDGAVTTDTSYYYSKSTIQLELTAGDNITIIGNTISATDTTYSNFTGTDGVSAGTAGLVPAPATTDAGKFLKADGTWDTAGGGGGDSVYSDKTTSNSNDGGAVYIGDKDATQTVQSDPTTTDNNYKYFWALPFNISDTAHKIIPGDETINIGGSIGAQVNGSGVHNISIGYRSKINDWEDGATVVGWQARSAGYGTAIGTSSVVSQNYGIAIGYEAQVYKKNSVALGKGAYPSRQGEVNIGCDNTTAFNNTNYRVIGGVHDGQDLHDAATVAQGNTLAAAAPDTSTVGVLGQLWTDTTNMHTYQLGSIDTTDPANPVYNWIQRW